MKEENVFEETVFQVDHFGPISVHYRKDVFWFEDSDGIPDSDVKHDFILNEIGDHIYDSSFGKFFFLTI